MVMMPYTSSTKPGLSRVYQKKIILYQLFRGCIIFFFSFFKTNVAKKSVLVPCLPCCPVSVMLPLLPQGDPEPLFFFSKDVRKLFCKLWGFS